MKTTYDAMMELDPDGLANILTMAYLCGKIGTDDPEFLSCHEEYCEMVQKFRANLDHPYEDGMWTLSAHSPVLPGDDLWWVCDEPPYVRCAKNNIKAVCMWEDGDIRIVNSEDGIEKLHERWTCLSKEEAVEMFKSMVKTGKIDPELYFEGIRSLLGSKSGTLAHNSLCAGRICDANSSREATCYTDEELDEMIAKLEDIGALVEEILEGEDDE